MSGVFTYCPTCSTDCSWHWEEAFDKFGFNDGDGLVMTEVVANSLRKRGYIVETHTWGWHNTIINRISRDGISVIPETARIGYDKPRTYQLEDIIDILDADFSDGEEVQP